MTYVYARPEHQAAARHLMADTSQNPNALSDPRLGRAVVWDRATGATKLAAVIAFDLLETCKRCGGEMRPGKVMEQALFALPDCNGFASPVFIGPIPTGRMVDQCKACGWSVA